MKGSGIKKWAFYFFFFLNVDEGLYFMLWKGAIKNTRFKYSTKLWVRKKAILERKQFVF